MSVTAVNSFSDAHEAREIPVIAGNLQSLCIPKQNLIWAVLRADDSRERLEYSMAAGFLGRICLSGDIERLTEEQWDVITRGIRFYQSAESVLLSGKTRVFREGGQFIRHPKGLQVVVRENEREALLVFHGFEQPAGEYLVPVDGECEITAVYGHGAFAPESGGVRITGIDAWTAGAVLLRKR